jgi:hypothetical protein
MKIILFNYFSTVSITHQLSESKHFIGQPSAKPVPNKTVSIFDLLGPNAAAVAKDEHDTDAEKMADILTPKIGR